MELGDQIELTGFSEEDSGELIIIKKLVGNYVKHVTERLPSFERLVLTRKESHGRHAEVHGKLLWDGREAFCDVTDENLFFAIDKCLKKLEHQTRS